MAKQCSRCFSTIPCTSDANCWCFSEKLSETTLKDISTVYDDCLCSNCLKTIQNEGQQNSTSSINSK